MTVLIHQIQQVSYGAAQLEGELGETFTFFRKLNYCVLLRKWSNLKVFYCDRYFRTAFALQVYSTVSCCVCFLIVVHPLSERVWGRSSCGIDQQLYSHCSVLLFSASAALSFGQGTDLGTIRGTVTDSAGGVIPDASVTITDALTNTDRKITTNALGYYEMFGLKSGTYTVTVTAPWNVQKSKSKM